MADLPTEIWIYVIQNYLRMQDVGRLSRTSKGMKALCYDDSVWRKFVPDYEGAPPAKIKCQRTLCARRFFWRFDRVKGLSFGEYFIRTKFLKDLKKSGLLPKSSKIQRR